jgi:hypothetical protein
VEDVRRETLGPEPPPSEPVPLVNGTALVAPRPGVGGPVNGGQPSSPSVYDYFTELDEKIRALREATADRASSSP